MVPTEAIGLILAGAAGGAINAVAGGGTLVTFPTLLFFGTAPIVANATSTLALVVGTSGSLYGYRRHLRAVAPWLWRFVPVSVLGGVMTLGALAGYYLGSHYSQRIPQKQVRQIITAIGFILSAVTFYQQFIR